MINNESAAHLLSHSPHLSPFWTLSRSAEESTPSPDPPESAVVQRSQQRAAAEERREEEKDERGVGERHIYKDIPQTLNSLKLPAEILHVGSSKKASTLIFLTVSPQLLFTV